MCLETVLIGFLTSYQDKQKAKVREKLDKCFKEKLMDFCDVLNIPINRSAVKKVGINIFNALFSCYSNPSNTRLISHLVRPCFQEELTVKILEFLESPHSTTDLLLADKEQVLQSLNIFILQLLVATYC